MISLKCLLFIRSVISFGQEVRLIDPDNETHYIKYETRWNIFGYVCSCRSFRMGFIYWKREEGKSRAM
jgi:hypothetical protein